MALNDGLLEALRATLTGEPLSHRIENIEKVHPKQAKFILATEPHIAFVAGRGTGKTWGGAYRALRAAYGYIGHERVIPVPNLGMVTAPTYPLLRDGSLRAFYDVAEDYIRFHNRSENVMTLNNGSEILWRSVVDPDQAVRGPSVSWWWGDEAAQYRPDVRLLATAMLRQFGKRGYEWLTTTPRGRNYLYQTYVRDHLDEEGWLLIQASSYENAFLESDVIDNFAADYLNEEFKRQEIYGEFVSFAGLVYDAFSYERHVYEEQPHVSRYNQMIAGVDWGHANPGCIVVIGIDAYDIAHVVEERYLKQTTIDEWVQHAHLLREKWGIEAFYCDPSDPVAVSKFNQRAGIYAVPGMNDVLPGIRQVQNRLAVNDVQTRPRLRIHSSCVNLLREIETYQWQIGTDGTIREAVVKANDHAMDALRYALFTAQDHRRMPERRSGSRKYL